MSKETQNTDRYLVVAGFIAEPRDAETGTLTQYQRGDVITLDADIAAVESQRGRVVAVNDGDARITATQDAEREAQGGTAHFRSVA
jgi:hypothetical protein